MKKLIVDDAFLNRFPDAAIDELAALLQKVTPFTPAVIWSQICQGWPGLVLQLLAVPCMVWGLRFFLMRDGRHD